MSFFTPASILTKNPPTDTISHWPKHGPRPSPQPEIPCGGWREHTCKDQPIECPPIYPTRGYPPLLKSSGIRCWRDTVLVLSAFDTVFPPLCVLDARGGKNGLVVQFEPAWGHPTNTQLPLYQPVQLDFAHINIYIYVNHYDSPPTITTVSKGPWTAYGFPSCVSSWRHRHILSNLKRYLWWWQLGVQKKEVFYDFSAILSVKFC